jgi:cysteine desulfurase family protein
VQGLKTIYFDNAATSWPKPAAMMEAMVTFNDAVGANPGRSGHRLSVDASRVIYEARELVAEAIGAPDPLTIVFTKNATEALNTVLLGLLKTGDHVVTSSMEHNSVMRPLRYLERKGVDLSVIPCSSTGILDPEDLQRHFKKNTKLVIATHASNVTGTLFPVNRLSEITRDCGILLAVDASQTAGSVPIDVARSGIDILCFTGHKSLMGPQGTGGFYLRQGVEGIPLPLTRGGTGSASELEEQPTFLPDLFESGTPNGIGIAGLAAGVRFVLDTGIDYIWRKEQALTRRFIEGLKRLPDVTLYGPRMDETERTSVVSFTVRGLTPSDVSYELDERFSILSRPGLHCAPAAHRTIGTFPQGTVRFSFGFFNTEDEIDLSLDALAQLSSTSSCNSKGESHV